MRTPEENMARANDLLAILAAENILTPESVAPRLNFRKFKDVRMAVFEQPRTVPAPFLTKDMAITNLKVGACAELCHRFALEYFLKYKAQDIHLVYLNSREGDVRANDNHTVILLGSLQAKDELIAGRGVGTVATYAASTHYAALKEFFSSQKSDAILIDPLLGVADFAMGDCATFYSYCEEHAITDVVAIKSFTTTAGIIEAASLIKSNAVHMARRVNRELSFRYLDELNTCLWGGDRPEWNFNSESERYVLRATPDKIEELLKLFREHGFTEDEVQESKGKRTGEKFLTISKLKMEELDLTRILQLVGSVAALITETAFADLGFGGAATFGRTFGR